MTNKRGSIVDIAFLLVVAMVHSIFLLVVSYVFPQITAGISASPIGNLTSSQSALNSTNTIAGSGNMVFLTIFIGLCITVLITSFFIDSSRILVPIYIIGVGFLILFAVIVENVYEGFAESATFAATAATQPTIDFIMNHLVAIAIGVGVLSMILIFAKSGGVGGSSQPF
jgi:hypothetical protein